MLYAIETEEITKRIDDIVAVNKISISVKPGELFRLSGTERGRQNHSY